jgi:hypothetical protein
LVDNGFLLHQIAEDVDGFILGHPDTNDVVENDRIGNNSEQIVGLLIEQLRLKIVSRPAEKRPDRKCRFDQVLEKMRAERQVGHRLSLS